MVLLGLSAFQPNRHPTPEDRIVFINKSLELLTITIWDVNRNLRLLQRLQVERSPIPDDSVVSSMTPALNALAPAVTGSECAYHPGVRRDYRARASSVLSFLLLLLPMILLVLATSAQASAQRPVDWERVASLKPKLKVLILVSSDRPFSISDLALLADRALVPADRDPGLVIGLREAVFSTRLGKWMKNRHLPAHLKAALLTKFRMSGVYRLSFKVEEKGYVGPLNLQVTAPRDGFGKKLVASDHVVRPAARSELDVQPQGNRWLSVRYPKVHSGQVIKFHFGFTYLVDVSDLLDRDLILAGNPKTDVMPAAVKQFLKPGYKIDPGIAPALDWASRGGQGRPDARREYDRLNRHLKKNVVYDKRKRKQYFGGKTVYYDIDDMYQDPQLTLARGAGCCPDTILVECAFLRARGVPCRTAGRFGHFYSMVYVPGKGWMSTSVTPTGIPLLEDPGPDFLPYQYWEPRIRLKTTMWEARIRIRPLESETAEPSEVPVAKPDMPLRKNDFSARLKQGALFGEHPASRTREASPFRKSHVPNGQRSR
jgi:Transglutaminase-like superfamily